MVLIFTTSRKKFDAIKIGKGLLKARLIACYNLFPVESSYWWKGEILNEKEILMILKTKESNFKKIEAYIKKLSGYEIPEVIAIRPTIVNTGYLDWILKETD